ncbi:MAG: carbohydrate-binding domain-containing protein [Bacteroidaceae bacterium]|nr:carbohydrate-binding domain-containing protein [Bacteroidaceae bacterium]
MKRTLLTLILSLCVIAMSAQTTLRVTRGTIHEVFNATADEMLFSTTAEGSTVTIGGITYLTDEITAITIGEESVADGTVSVTYLTDGTAEVIIAGDVAPYLYTTVSGQDVSIDTDTTYTGVIAYTLAGTATAGSFTMDGKNNTTLTLNGVSITSPDTAAINIRNGKHCTINVLGTNTFADGATGGQKGAFFCNGHATFQGDGTVNITGNARHGYRSDEYTVFSEDFTGTFNILSAASDAINVQQYLTIANGTFTITNNTGDGIDVGINNDSTKTRNGQLLITGGTISVSATTADTKAIKADSTITVTGGTFNINVTGNGCKGISAGTDFRTSSGTFNLSVTGSSYYYITPLNGEDSSRCQGIRAKQDFYLVGDATNFPTFNINTDSDDEKTYGIRIKGWFYYTAAALRASGFNTKDAKWTSGQAKQVTSWDF